MTKFQIDSNSFIQNIWKISNLPITNNVCNIHINEELQIQLPLFIAAGYSTVISNQLNADSSQTDFYLTSNYTRPFATEFYNKLTRVLNLQEVIIENDDEIFNFAECGKSFGCDLFIQPLRNKINETKENPTTENVFQSLKLKIWCKMPPSECEPELGFIASEFDATKQQLLQMSDNFEFEPFLEAILKHNSLSLQDEDSLLSFVMTLCRKHSEYLYFFENVYLEHCSHQKLREFLVLIQDIVPMSREVRAIINCLTRRAFYGEKAVSNETSKRYKVNLSKGILKTQYSNAKNVKLKGSGVIGNIYDIISDKEHVTFYTEDAPDRWIQASLVDNKAFVLTHYALRGNNLRGECQYQLQSWILEGRKQSDGKWIQLDSKSDDPLYRFEWKLMKLPPTEPLDAIKLTQTGHNSNGNDILQINAIDIFGTIIG